jgi:deoxyribodipyrimidine photolyase-related protein
MDDPALVLVLGDQLTPDRGALRDARPGIDHVVMAEVRAEATYVPHNRHKIALVFAAMRHFRDALREQGFHVHYFEYGDGLATLREAVERSLRDSAASTLRYTQPAEYRLQQEIAAWQPGVPVEVCEDDHFLASPSDFAQWAQGRKQLRMEYFYREMRKRYGILLDDLGGPEGGKWNYDAHNRKGWRADCEIPARPDVEQDDITRQVLALVAREFPDNPGLLANFNFATERMAAQAQLDWFTRHALGRFGTYQDALAEESPWLFHSLVSMYLNIGLLEPLATCRQVEQAYRDGACELAAAEGFIRQVLGCREYVRRIHWLAMPDYAARNTL